MLIHNRHARHVCTAQQVTFRSVFDSQCRAGIDALRTPQPEGSSQAFFYPHRLSSVRHWNVYRIGQPSRSVLAVDVSGFPCSPRSSACFMHSKYLALLKSNAFVTGETNDAYVIHFIFNTTPYNAAVCVYSRLSCMVQHARARQRGYRRLY